MAMVLGPSLPVVMSVMISLSKPDELCSGPGTGRLFSHEGRDSVDGHGGGCIVTGTDAYDTRRPRRTPAHMQPVYGKTCEVAAQQF